MVTTEYRDWVADDKPWIVAQPIADIASALRRHGYTVYTIGNEDHLTANPPEDHTPYSATGWPVPAPYPVVNACDIMPPTAGQRSKLDGRLLPSLAQLGAQLRTDRLSGHTAMTWLKYINWEPGDGTCWHDSWQPGYARRASTDRGHIHLSGRSDLITSTMAAGYDPVARIRGDDIPTTDEIARALLGAKLSNGRSVNDVLVTGFQRLPTDLAAIIPLVRQAIAEAADDPAVLSAEQLQAAVQQGVAGAAGSLAAAVVGPLAAQLEPHLSGIDAAEAEEIIRRVIAGVHLVPAPPGQ